MALTDIKVRAAKPTDKQYKLTDGGGMHLLVHPNGSKYWRLQYRYEGKQKMLALGIYPEITLADARVRRDEARKLLANGVDPGIRRQLVLPTRANYTGRTLQCDIKSRLLLPSLSFSCSFHLSVRTYIRDGSAGLPPPPP